MLLVYILYVRGNHADMDGTEYYVKHVVFAVLRELDAETSTALLSLAAPRCMRSAKQPRASFVMTRP